MKASLSGDMASQVLVLTPESDDDRRMLGNLASMTTRICNISHRGFGYMDPDVSFIIQKTSRGD